VIFAFHVDMFVFFSSRCTFCIITSHEAFPSTTIVYSNLETYVQCLQWWCYDMLMLICCAECESSTYSSMMGAKVLRHKENTSSSDTLRRTLKFRVSAAHCYLTLNYVLVWFTQLLRTLSHCHNSGFVRWCATLSFDQFDRTLFCGCAERSNVYAVEVTHHRRWRFHLSSMAII